MLTADLMRNAHFAHSLDMDPDLKGRGAARAAQWAREMGVNVDRAKDEYRKGKVVLAQYTLTYSQRFVLGAVEPPVPPDAAGAVRVPAGHIATNEAFRLAIFHA